jgi:hypothetical protein
LMGSMGFAVLILAALLTTAAAEETNWCRKKHAECRSACHSSSNIDFHCRDSKGAKDVSCSCIATAVKFGHASAAQKPAPSSVWWPAWLDSGSLGSPVVPSSPLNPARLGVDPPPTTEPGESPLRTICLAPGAALITGALLACVAGLAFILTRAWTAITARRARPTGAAYKTAAASTTGGLDLEAGDHPDAVVLQHAKA